MTASRTGLVILAALALALAVVHLAIGAGAAVESRAPFADMVATEPVSMRWDRAGAAPIEITRTGDAWTMSPPVVGPVDPAAVADIVAALRGARWQRKAATLPGPVRFTVSVGGESIAIGPEVAGAGGWIRRGTRAYLIDAWVIAALDREPLALRQRAPFAAALAGVHRIEVHGPDVAVVLDGNPLALVIAPGAIRLAPDVAAALLDHLGAVHVEAVLGGEPAPAPDAPVITVVGAARADVTVHGPCPDRPGMIWISGPASGEACVGLDAIVAFELAVKAIAGDPLAVADRRLVAAPIKSVTLLSGAVLAWRGATVEVDGAPADDDAAARVAAALATDAVPVAIPVPRPRATGAIAIDGQAFELYGADVLAPPDSAYGHRVTAETIAALRLAADQLRDRLVLLTEPAVLAAITLDGRAIAPDTEWAQAVAEALREVRVVRFVPTAPTPPRATIEVSYQRPQATAPLEVHRLALGPRTRDGCIAVVDATAAVLPPAVCATLEKPSPP